MRLVTRFLYLLAVFASFTYAESEWKPRGDGVHREQLEGASVFRFERGYLDSESLNIRNGIIEFDLKSGGERAFFYIYFRRQSADTSEVVYIRTHKSNAPDTLQYSPVVQGRSAWQVYHGGRGTASATLVENSWTPVKLKFIENSLDVWVGDKHVMQGVKLVHSTAAGSLSLRGGIPRASHASETGYVRNIKVTPLPEEEAPVDSRDRSQTNLVSQYRVSNAFSSDKSAYLALPDVTFNATEQWLEVDEYGVLPLLMHRQIPQGERSWAILAEVTLRSSKTTLCEVTLGFSDAISVLLDGSPLAHVDASYRYNENRQEGLLHSKQMTLFVPLKQGLNNLQFVVADSFGGWGLRAELVNCEGVSAVGKTM